MNFVTSLYLFQELVKSLQVDLQNAQNDNRALRDREEKWETSKVQTVREYDGDEQRIKMLMSTFEAEREVIAFTYQMLLNNRITLSINNSI